MKKLALLSMLAVIQCAVSAQTIPNAGFENWNLDNGWTLSPDDWQTANSQIIEHVTQDTLSYEGDYAMRVTYSETPLGQYGEASTSIPLAAIPEALSFYVKAEIQFSSVGVDVAFYNGDNNFYTETWYAWESIGEWTPVIIELNQIEPIMTHAVITVHYSAGDFVEGSGWISVDAMSFDNSDNLPEILSAPTTLLYQAQNQSLKVPAIGQLSIFDSSGKLVLVSNNENSVAVNHLLKGHYIAVHESSKQRESLKWVKE